MRKQTFRINKWLILVITCVVLVASGCTRPISISVAHKTPMPSVPGETLLAGVAKADITPPPGMPMAGYSTFSVLGNGVRSKLMARVIYIKPAKEKPIALVQCDLLGGSRIVHHKVAELVADETDIDIAGLLMAGTHTHSGPGNYFSCGLYNKFAQAKCGFNKEYFDFLCIQIAEAVKKACKTRRPARIATGSIKIEGVTYNRSFPAFLKNKDLKNREEFDPFNAVNPYLHLIRIDCMVCKKKDIYKPIGVFTSFSIHPNTKPRKLDRLYNPDVVGHIERLLEAKIKQSYEPPWEPVHAFVNSTHGDNNPYYGEDISENCSDFNRVGEKIVEKAFKCFKELDVDLLDNVDIRYRAKEIDVLTDNFIDDITIAENPKLGMAKLGGAMGPGRGTILRGIPFITPGCPRLIFTCGEQGHKRILAGPFQYLIIPKSNFPRHLFLQVIKIHDFILMPVPWEVTFQMGKRISKYAEEKGKAPNKDPGKYIVISCSNDYWGYVTTAEEYTSQYYEGASNSYGPNTGDFIKYHMCHMVEALASGKNCTKLPPDWVFKLRARNFYPKKLIPNGKRRIHKHPIYYEKKKHAEPFWSFQWYDVPVNLIDFHRPLVCIEVLDENGKVKWNPLYINGQPVDDSGSNISIHYLKKTTKKNMELYETKWYNPPENDGKYYRFVIHSREGQKELCSLPFK